VLHDLETVPRQQAAVFVGGEARVIERLPVQLADRHAVVDTRGEQQQPARRDVLSEDREHAALRFAGQMEEAVPGDDGVEPLAQREAPHVADHPGHRREPRFAKVDHGRCRIDAGDATVVVDEIARDWLAHAATEVEHRATFQRLTAQERIEVSGLHQLPPAVAIEGGGVRLVDVHDFRHAAPVSAAGRR
jgi:hypothetical protein